MSNRHRLIAVAAVLAATVAVLGGATASSAEPAPKPRLYGSAVMQSIPEATITFSFNARGVDHDATGTIRVTHVEGDFDMWAEARVTCLHIGGPVATVTGEVTRASHPELVGGVNSFSVYDGGRGHDDDLISVDWQLGWQGELPPCMAPAPSLELADGGYTVRG